MSGRLCVPVLACLLVGCAPFGKGKKPEATTGPTIEELDQRVARIESAPDPAIEIARLKQQVKKISSDPAPVPVPPPPAEKYLTIPDVVTGDVDDWIVIRPDTNYSSVLYLAADKGLKVFPSEELINKTNTVVESRIAGDYRMFAVTAENDQPKSFAFIVRVGHAPQPPPGPGPQPGPTPPGPTPPAPAKVQKLQIVILTDAANPKPAVKTFLRDPYFAQGTGPLVPANALYRFGHKTLPYDTTSVQAGVAVTTTYAAQIKAAKGYPMILIFDLVTMKWLNTDPADMVLPDTAESLKALLSKFTTNL